MFKTLSILLLSVVNISVYSSGLKSYTPLDNIKEVQKLANKNNTTAERAEYIKELYYSVNGYPDGYDTSMKADPHLNLFNMVLGENGVGGILYSAGYTTCEEIPASGSASGTVQGIGTLNLTFGTPAKTVPSYYGTDGGTTMDRKITVQDTSSVTITIELKCNTNTAIQTGYVKMDFTEYEIVYEGFFQQNSSTGAVDLDIYIKTEGGGGNLLIPTQFRTADGQNFTIYSGYISLSGSGNQYVVAVNGSTSGKAQIAYLSTTETTGAATTTAPNNYGSLPSAGGTFVSVECIDVANETVTTGCTSIPAPGSLSIGGQTSNWTVGVLKSISL